MCLWRQARPAGVTFCWRWRGSASGKFPLQEIDQLFADLAAQIEGVAGRAGAGQDAQLHAWSRRRR